MGISCEHNFVQTFFTELFLGSSKPGSIKIQQSNLGVFSHTPMAHRLQFYFVIQRVAESKESKTSYGRKLGGVKNIQGYKNEKIKSSCGSLNGLHP